MSELDDEKPRVDATDEAIRKMLLAQEEEPVAPPQPKPAPRMPAPEMQPVQHVLHAPVQQIVQAAAEDPEYFAEPEPEGPGLKGRALAFVKDFLRRPDAPRIFALVLLAVFLLYKPWQVFFLALFGVAIIAITYFSLGPERCAELVAAWFEKLKARDPEKAEQLRQRAIRMSQWASKTLALLPERWTAGLYLPDFQPGGEMPEKMKSDPFDRLVAQSQSSEAG